MKKTLANSIEILMEKKGFNIAELAHILNIPKATLHKIITGKSVRPHQKTLSIISGYFQVPIADLLRGEIDDFIQQNKIKNIPILEWNNIYDWLKGKIQKERFQQTTPTNLEISEKSFALILSDVTSTIFKSNSILIFDPALEIRDGSYVLVKLFEHSEILLRQILCDASNKKYLKSLNQEFSTSIKQLEENDKVVAILVMAKTLFYQK